ncbi:SGNH/GDSL hydrolase family protein [Solibacillus sp. FSL H8-0538]|uniref:SGNH/GDSL hydrolase family protein n=1 Tax=Solibacillus sp. FSL H8-0538 TaxID=2921400 RepID=UPI0030F8697E
MLLPVGVKAQAVENYIVLGDSLAAGQTPYSQIDAGYTDFIALQLTRSGQLANFTKELAFPGYTVANVLASVQTERADELLADATLITISAGANDLLRLVSHNPNAGTLSFSQLTADFALNTARKDFATLLETVGVKAPNAKVYVMGYYFPYVNVHESQKAGTTKQLVTLNAILQQEAEIAEATFVPVYKQFEVAGPNYLPNVEDVHPNQNGYRVMANAFLEIYAGNESLAMPENAMPTPNPLTFEEILQLQQDAKSEDRKTEQVAVDASVQKRHHPINMYVMHFGYKETLFLS